MNKTAFIKMIFIILLGVCACQSATKSNHVSILQMDSLVIMVADCFFLEGEIHIEQWQDDIKDYSLVKYGQFFEERGITKEIFTENVRYYISNEKYAEKFMNKIDEIVEQRVAALRDSLNQ